MNDNTVWAIGGAGKRWDRKLLLVVIRSSVQFDGDHP